MTTEVRDFKDVRGRAGTEETLPVAEFMAQLDKGGDAAKAALALLKLKWQFA